MSAAIFLFLALLPGGQSPTSAPPVDTLQQARRLLRSNQPDRAAELLKNNRQRYPNRGDFFILLAAASALSRDWPSAEEAYTECLRLKPGDPILLAGLGVSLLEQEKFSEAARTLERSLALRSEEPRLWFLLSQAQLFANQVSESVSSFRRAVALEPGNEDFYLDFGQFLMEGLAYQQAEQIYRHGLAQIGSSLKIQFALAVCLQLQLKWKTARTLLQDIIARNPSFPRAYLSLGRSFVESGEPGPAEEAYLKAIEQDPADLESSLYYGILLSQTGRLEAAESRLLKVVQGQPSNPRGHLELGRLYLAQSRLAEAEEALNRARKADPTSKEACFELGQLYRRQNRLSEAEAAFRKYTELERQEKERLPRTALLSVRRPVSPQ